MFELQSLPVPELGELGESVLLRELPYGRMREVMSAGDGPGQAGERLLGACLEVDGEAVGYEGLLALPGRFGGAIARVLEQVLRLHGLMREDAADAAPKA